MPASPAPSDPSPDRRTPPGRLRAVAATAAGGLLLAGLLAAGGAGPVAADPSVPAAPAAPAASTAGRLPALVGTWGASADRTDSDVAGRTVRNVVRTNVGGRDLRVSLSNVVGTAAVTYSGTVGVSAGGGAVEPGSLRGLTFGGGETSVLVPPGAEVLSDPLTGRWAEQLDLAVSVHVDGDPGVATGHNLAVATSYVSEPGDVAAEEGADAFTTALTRWHVVDGLVVTGARGDGTVVALGDSITDGYGATVDGNQRWPDHLARRLLATPRYDGTGVVNEGISGNRVLSDGAGVSALARLDRDVLTSPGVETVVLLEGINDISGGATAEEVIAGYRQLIARTHAAGVCIQGGTLTAFESAGPAREAERTAVNEWIRSSGEFDAVVDFDAATRDPSNPDKLLPAYDSGDDLHPSDAGYAAMAAAVDLRSLDCRR